MARCIIGLGGPQSSSFPFLRAHVGRAFVEHIADVRGYPLWREISSASADICEHPQDGVILCRLWAQANATSARMSVRRCLQYLDVKSSEHVAVAHPELRRPCGQFGVAEGAKGTPTLVGAREVLEAIGPMLEPKDKAIRVQIGVGGTSSGILSPSLHSFGEEALNARDAGAILESVFPAAYEWLRKRWFGAVTVTEGMVYRQRMVQHNRKGPLELANPYVLRLVRPEALAPGSRSEAYHGAQQRHPQERGPTKGERRAAK
eukprot:CAMPEP_0178377082 /NCGR_PEP_ID=MMETSP0689_2-20121128/3735_1 /TAXON_ID=160604 /ORGANISM="Amphidinium massartii, Strain CS-259" /LENGTH=260 /DNA_ID=CAMNT_0019997125 /DNA_START=33 /DNA_END=812 /DNA_ORIENTATION=+